VLCCAGKKLADYWDPSKKLLSDANKFLDSLLTFDKENIPDAVIKKIEPYIAWEGFTPEAVAKVSKACTSICMWVRAMHLYHTVSLSVSADTQQEPRHQNPTPESYPYLLATSRGLPSFFKWMKLNLGHRIM
jgi:hypothetical protein